MEREYYLRRLDLAQLTAPPFGVGAFLDGNILLIGEQASNPDTAPNQQPFCSSKGCSGWINKLFEAEGIPEEKLFWLNALNNDDSAVDLRSFTDLLRPTAVIALGTVAKSECAKQGIHFHPVHHPQYWKRFKSKYRYPLLDLLQALVVKVPDRPELLLNIQSERIGIEL